MTTKLHTIIDELNNSFRKLYGNKLSHIVLYGSKARGDDKEGSDIDVLVVLKGRISPCEEIIRTLDIVAEISLKHTVVISCFFISEEQFESEQSPLLINIRREGILI